MRALFLVNGLGLGNSTRCYALLRQLTELGVESHVLTSGNGLKFFSGKPEVKSLHSMPALSYGAHGARVSLPRTLLKVPRWLPAGVQKSRCLRRVVEMVRPDVAVVDSEYCLAPLKRNRIPVVAINHSHLLISRFWRARKPRGLKLHFWMVEVLDYLFHLAVPDLVLSPTPPRGGCSKRLIEVGLMVRDEFKGHNGGWISPREVRRAVYVKGGSELSRRLRLPLGELPFPVEVAEGEVSQRMRAADCLIIHGGWSSICEAVALNKPTLSVPLPGHSEQYLNAGLLEEWGCGQRLGSQSLLPSLWEQYQADRWKVQAAITRPSLEGAAVAAKAVLKFLGS